MSEPNDSNQPPPVPPSQPSVPQQPQQPQQANPYAGGAPSPYEAAPTVNPYGVGAPAYPGTRAYVEQQFGPVAGFGSRVGAFLIDVLLSFIGLIPLIIGLVLLVVAGPDVDEFGNSVSGTGDAGMAAMGGILALLGVLLMWGIVIWNRIFKMGRTGQSVGKKAMGLKLIHEQTGQPIGAGMAFGREILSQFINQILFLSNLWMLWDDNKQTLHDKIVSSTVIEVPKS
ncbi:RDD family protein [Knoellia sp. CPCC 206453]|uniref:RDD family protein n=1 Tax=Knoellia pratensis TaxID=3404796 RepID=UPI0036171643